MRPPLARAALALYPPSWRARYGDEVLALLDDSGGGPAAVASLAWRALPAWFCPPRHLHDRPARMRASLATALMSWSMLAGLGLVFAQLTQLQGLAPRRATPQIRWAYAVFDVTLATSALIAGLGGLPLWLLMLRRARREQRTRDTVYLLLPVIAPVAYLAGLIVTARLVGGANGVSQGWFGVVTAGRVRRGRHRGGRTRPGPAQAAATGASPAPGRHRGRRVGRGHGGRRRGHRGRRDQPEPVGPAVRRLSRRHPVGHLPGAGRRRRDRHHGERRARHPRRAGLRSVTYTATMAAAAVKVAASLGVHGTDPVILADGANVIVHLRPAPVVAKVAASTPAVRPDDAAWLQRELDIARFLAGRGVPVMTPSPEVPPPSTTVTAR